MLYGLKLGQPADPKVFKIDSQVFNEKGTLKLIDFESQENGEGSQDSMQFGKHDSNIFLLHEHEPRKRPVSTMCRCFRSIDPSCSWMWGQVK